MFWLDLQYEFDVYITPREEMEYRAWHFISERDGASTLALAEELGIDPHRTALFMKSIGGKFYRAQKKWFLTAAAAEPEPEPEAHDTSGQE